jgi:hypothetical protein
LVAVVAAVVLQQALVLTAALAAAAVVVVQVKLGEPELRAKETTAVPVNQGALMQAVAVVEQVLLVSAVLLGQLEALEHRHP